VAELPAVVVPVPFVDDVALVEVPEVPSAGAMAAAPPAPTVAALPPVGWSFSFTDVPVEVDVFV
jgi:hypothetical protein